MLGNAMTPELFELLEQSSAGDIDFYCQYARQSGGPVLVLLCGTGRIAIPIARQGIPVIGLDSVAGVVDLAKRKAQQANAGRAVFVPGDPTHFVSENKHALVIIPGGALARLLTADEQRQALTAVRGALQVGGRLLLDMPLFEPTLHAADPPTLKRSPATNRNAVVQKHRRFDGARQLVETIVSCDWLGDGGEAERREYTVYSERYATPTELVLLLDVCGFAATCYRGFDREPLGPGATRLVIEAERKR